MKLPSVRRARIAGLAVTVAAGGVLAVPSTSHAGVLDSPQSLAGVTFSGSASCTASGPGAVASPATPFAADGVPVTTTATSSATYTHNVDNTDVTTMTGSSTNTIRATQAAGALKTLDIAVTSQKTLQAAKGAAQACDASVSTATTNTGSFDLPTPKYVTLDIESKDAVGIVVFQNSAGPVGGGLQTVNYFLHSHLNQRLYLPAGTWSLINQNQDVLQAPTPTPTPVMGSARSSKLELHATFDDPGVATRAAEGSGKKYLDLADGRTCVTGALAATWKAKAGKRDNRKVKKAVFRIDDVKVKTVRKPKKKQTTTLTGLDPDQPAEVSVTIKLAKKGAGKVTVDRTYLPCT